MWITNNLKQQLGLINQLMMLKLLWHLKMWNLNKNDQTLDGSVILLTFWRVLPMPLCRGAWCITNIYVYVVSIIGYNVCVGMLCDI